MQDKKRIKTRKTRKYLPSKLETGLNARQKADKNKKNAKISAEQAENGLECKTKTDIQQTKQKSRQRVLDTNFLACKIARI